MRNPPHGEAVDIRHALRERVARHDQTELQSFYVGDSERFRMQNCDCITGAKLDLLAALRQLTPARSAVSADDDADRVITINNVRLRTLETHR